MKRFLCLMATMGVLGISAQRLRAMTTEGKQMEIASCFSDNVYHRGQGIL